MPKKTKPFKITFKEEGRGKGSTTSFATLAAAATYIRDRWQGADYIDHVSRFHTDYATYALTGFTLKDIGTISYHGETPYYWREFTFADWVKETEEAA